MTLKKTNLEDLYYPLESNYNELLDDILKLNKEIKKLEDDRSAIKTNDPNGFLGWKKTLNEKYEDRGTGTDAEQDFADALTSKTTLDRKKSKVDNNELLQQIKENISTISIQLDDDDDNTIYLHSILEATSSFVSKLTSTMNEKNAEAYAESVQSYSTSEKEKNKTNTGLQSLNRIMGELSRLIDSGKIEEYNKLLKSYSTIEVINRNFQIMSNYDN